jgi:hypothetical protein
MKSSVKRHLNGFGFAFLLLLVATPCPMAPAASTVNVIVMTGDPAPDGNGSYVALDIAPALNDTGQVAFVATLTNTNGGFSDDRGIFRSDDARIVQIARESQFAPDGNGKFGTFESNFHTVSINESGQVAFDALLYDTAGAADDDAGVFRGDGTTLVQLAREGQMSPDGNGSFGAGFGEHALNNAGQVSFRSNLAGAIVGTREGLFRADGTALVTIARGGQDAPGGIGKFSQFDVSTSINDAGQVAFAGYTSNVSGIFRGDGTNLTLIARTNDASPDGNGRYVGTPSYSTRLNELGQAAFFANFSNTLGGASDNTGILRGDGASLVSIAREGQLTPDGNGAFAEFTGLGFTAPAALNDLGQVAFDASLAGTLGGNNDNYGIFRSDGTTLVQIVREGQATPDGNGRFDLRSRPALNDAGQLAFRSELSGTSGGASDNAGIFFFDDALGLLQVVRKGDAFLGSTITSLSFAPPELWGDEGSGLNKSGLPRVAYFFRLADSREGIAIWTLVPEPSSAILLAVVMLSVCRSITWRHTLKHASICDGRKLVKTGSRHLAVTKLLVFVAAGGPALTHGFEFATIALSGQPAADIGGEIRYGEVGAAELNNRGEVAFWSEGMTGPDVDLTNNGARFAGAPGAVRLVSRAGDHAPGAPSGARFGPLFGIHLLSDSGQIAFGSQLREPGVVSGVNSVWLGTPGSPTLLAREGDPAAGMPAGIEYASLQSSIKYLNGQGRLGFIGRIRGSGIDSPNNDAIWVGSPGDVTLVAREGDQPPGLPAGVRYSNLGDPQLNGSGQVAFPTQFTGSGINTSNYAGVFAGPPGAVRLIARTGQQAPGLPAGDRYEGTLEIRLNDAGHVALTGSANGQAAAWVGPPDALQLLGIGGTQAPGAPDGLNFYSFGPWGPYLAPDGDVVVVCELRSPTIKSNHYGLFTGRPGAMDLLARTGDAAPGTAAGAIFLRFFPVDHLLSDGGMAFEGRLQGPGVTDANDAGIWLVDPSGEMELVVREGKLFDVGGGDLRVINRLSFSAGSGFNDARQIAFQATFTDGSSGIFVTLVPEPPSAFLLVVGRLRVWRSRRRRHTFGTK